MASQASGCADPTSYHSLGPRVQCGPWNQPARVGTHPRHHLIEHSFSKQNRWLGNVNYFPEVIELMSWKAKTRNQMFHSKYSFPSIPSRKPADLKTTGTYKIFFYLYLKGISTGNINCRKCLEILTPIVTANIY